MATRKKHKKHVGEKYKSALSDFKVARILNGEEYINGYNRTRNNRSSIEKRFRSFVYACALTIVITLLLYTKNAHSASRIKDIVYFEGIRENTLLGYGLVVGLNGTGDNLKNSPFTEKGLTEFLSKLGINSKGTNMKTKNVAAVTITASFPAFARVGSKFDVTVSTLGDAKSLEGGTLLASPLLGADGNVYGVAQGPIAMGGIISATESSNAKSKAVETNGTISNGAIVEREINFNLDSMKSLKLALRNPDVSTARRIAENINDALGEDVAMPLDPGTVDLKVPAIYGNNVVGLLADIEQLVVEPDQKAKIVIDEASGTIVMGEEVKVDTVAIAQGNLMVSVKNDDINNENQFNSETSAISDNIALVNNNENPGNGLAILPQGASLRDLVKGLNALGVGTRDLITILQTIKVAGALHADIEVR